MKAFLLAAGIGTRLRPLTDSSPKCMMPIGPAPGMRIPLLGLWMDALGRAGVTDVLVNTHHLPGQVNDYIDFRSRRHWWPNRVRTVHEPELLGSAGTLLANRKWIQDEEFFLACNADNLTDFPLADLISYHREHRPDATLVTHRAVNPSASGILETDSDGTMISFSEKPQHPVSDIANGGIYAFAPSVLDGIGREGRLPLDIGHDLLPRLTWRARTLHYTGFLRDIGTPEDYRLAQEEWNSLDHHPDSVAYRPGRRRN